MNILRLIQNTRCHSCYLNALRINNYLTVNYSTESANEEIIIPKRIPRGPTDILKALASVTKRDPTATHYKYHDDPYLIPLSNVHKRIYALSQESGRKAAKWIKDEHPELFQHIEAEPPIEAFLAKAQYDENDDLDNDLLARIIKSPSLSDAITVYNIMKKRGDEISDENKQALLELICFFNETEEISPDLIEEKWYSQSTKENQISRKTWKDNGLAQKLFEQLPESSETYSTIILGMVKHFQVEKAFQYYALAQEKQFVLSPDAYNSLIKVASYRADGGEQRWGVIENILKTMDDNGLKPTIGTLNAVLFGLSRITNFTNKQRYALKMIAEVRQFDVLPSLASYAHLLNVFYSDKNKVNIMDDILDDLENRKLTVEDPADVNFFSLAMEKCRYNLRDKEIAHRINRLLWQENNYDFIGNSYKEAAYYRNYFFLLLRYEALENVMRIYDYIVPHIYTPESSVIEELVKTITMNGVVELYQRVWTDIVNFDLYDKPTIMAALLEGMALNRAPITDPPSETATVLSDIAWSIYQKAEAKSEKRPGVVVEWTGKMLGEIIILLLHANRFEKATEIFKKLIKHENQIVGVPEQEVLSLYVDACVKIRNVKLAMDCITYSVNNSYSESKNLAKKLIKNINLSPAVESHLVAILGPDIYQDENDEKSKQRVAE